MTIAVLELLTSRAKWSKLIVLLRERTLISQYSLRQRLGAFFSWGRDEGQPSSESVMPVRSSYQCWRYTSRLDMPAPLIERGPGTRFKQDRRLAEDVLQADYDYETAIYNEAYFYSNGVSHVTLFDRHDKRVPEFSYAKYGRAKPQLRRLPVSRSLSGTTLSLYGNVENTAGNIGHWMIDALSRLFLVLSQHDIDEIDHVLVPTLRYGFQRESLNELGIPDEKIIEIDVLECVRCERLVVTSAPRGYSSSITPGWLIDGFRQALSPKVVSSDYPRRIYISRRDAGSRKFVNEEDIIMCLQSFGFQAVEMSNYDFNEKIALFSQAEMVVGLTGAGLTNLLFCDTDASVVELFPASYVTYFYTSIACYLGLDYHHIVFENDSVLSSMNKYYGNLSLNTEVLGRKVAEILARKEPSQSG